MVRILNKVYAISYSTCATIQVQDYNRSPMQMPFLTLVQFSDACEGEHLRLLSYLLHKKCLCVDVILGLFYSQTNPQWFRATSTAYLTLPTFP